MSWARMNELEPIALAYMLIVGSDKYLPRSVRLQGAVPGSLASPAGFELEALSGRERGVAERESAAEIPSASRDLDVGVPGGIRTRVTAVKGRCPGPG